jgi:hypothetical protein
MIPLLLIFSIIVDAYLASSRLVVFRPFGFEGGLNGQLMGYFGCIMIAFDNTRPGDANIMLPIFQSDIPGKPLRDVDFGELFDVPHFVERMESIGVHVLHENQVPHNATVMTLHHLGRKGCWKRVEWYPTRKSHPIQSAYWLALRPSSKIESRVQGFVGKSDLGRRYGCLHPRIEHDMTKMKDRVHVPLRIILDQMDSIPALHTVNTVFVAVGEDILESDDQLLQQYLSWGARIVRSRPQNNSSYIEDSLLDLEVCRRAHWFVGRSTSTFTTSVAYYRYLDTGIGWYQSCMWGIRYVLDEGHTDAAFCTRKNLGHGFF